MHFILSADLCFTYYHCTFSRCMDFMYNCGALRRCLLHVYWCYTIIVHHHLGHLTVGRQTSFMNHETTRSFETSKTASLSIMYLCGLFCLGIHVMHLVLSQSVRVSSLTKTFPTLWLFLENAWAHFLPTLPQNALILALPNTCMTSSDMHSRCT